MTKIEDLLAKLENYKKDRPFFKTNKIKIAKPSYIAWVDIMGTANALSISQETATIFIGKLHDAILISKEKTLFDGDIFPFVDGVYILSQHADELDKFLGSIFRIMALAFIFEEKPQFRVILRGALSYGNVILGKNILECNNSYKKNETYVGGILLGHPLSRAYSIERNAPPFGIFVDENLRHFSPKSKFSSPFWKWWKHAHTATSGCQLHCKEIAEALSLTLTDHYTWMYNNSHGQLYAKDAINRHKELAGEYFRET